MKRILTLLAFLLAAGTALPAQNYSLASRFSRANVRKMVFSTKVSPIWFQNSDKFIYSWSTSKGTEYYLVDPEKKTKTAIFDMDRLAMQLTSLTKDPVDAQHIELQHLQLEEDRYLTFMVNGSQKRIFEKNDSSEIAKKKRESKQNFHFRYDLRTGKLEDETLAKQDLENSYPYFISVSPDGKSGVYVKNRNLYLMDAENMAKAAKDKKDSTLVEIQLTTDGTADFAWGSDNYMGDTVTDSTERHRPYYIAWSPDSKKFATFRWDMSKIKDYWVINSTSTPRPTLETYKYQMPGEPGYNGTLHLFDLTDRSSKEIKVNRWKEQDLNFEYADYSIADRDKEQFRHRLTSVWKGDENGFYMLRQSRDQKNFDLCYVPVTADSVQVVLTESLNTYVESRPITQVNGGRQFVQWSERNGWANLYLYNADGTLVRNLTEGAYHVDRVLGVNEKDRYLIFSACGVNKDENPYQKHTYKVSFDGGDIVPLDLPDMDVEAQVAEDGRYFVANYSRIDHQPGSALYNARTGKKVMDLEEADLSLLLEAGYKFPERFKVKAADGVTDLYGEIYKPYDFDPEKSYPIIDYVYPGPQIEANDIRWRPCSNRTDRLAQLGFIVITVGNRGGHPDRSKWYHNYGYGNLRDYGLADQKYAIEQLADRYDWIDLERVGIHGHSGGGFMSTAAILTYPDFFKVAVSCAGNHDNRIYNRWWSEQHNGYDPENQAGTYQIGTNPELAKNLKGHLMLVHGDIDNNVHPANTIRVVDALIRNNKRFDLLILPGQRHGFGDMDEYFFWRMADYFSEWLLGDSKRAEVEMSDLINGK